MIIRALAVSAAMAVAPLMTPAALAQSSDGAAVEAQVQELYSALGLDQLLPIMRTEGVDYAGELEADMFPGRGGEDWTKLVGQIYDADRINTMVQDRFQAEFEGVDVAPLLAFFTSDTGRQIVTLEVSAREAMLDDTVEQMSRDSLARLRERGGSDLLDAIEAFVAANDLVETNVTGALNSNFAFYQGLVAGGAFTFDLSEEDMLRDVWAQEPEIRQETETWVYAYLALAYQPLEIADIEAYTALSKTPEGRALNSALFATFDELFNTLSRDLGVAAARFMSGEDI